MHYRLKANFQGIKLGTIFTNNLTPEFYHPTEIKKRNICIPMEIVEDSHYFEEIFYVQQLPPAEHDSLLYSIAEEKVILIRIKEIIYEYINYILSGRIKYGVDPMADKLLKLFKELAKQK